MPLDDALRVTREISAALDHAHRHGFVHCDIKPSNILLQDGEALVADFGIARAFQFENMEAAKNSPASPGTPAYRSPEQASGLEPVDARSDVYSLGVVLYEMLTGEVPTAPRARDSLTGVPPNVNRAIDKALSPSPADRFASTTAFARELTESVDVRQRVHPLRRRPRQLLRYAAGAVLAAVAIWAAVSGFGALGIGPSASLLSSGKLRSREPLIVTRFRVAGVDSSIADAVAHITRAALGESREVQLMPAQWIDDALRLMRRPAGTVIDLALAREIATRQGIRAIVDGHVVRTGERYEVGLRLITADSGRDLVALRESAANLDAVIPTLDGLTRSLRRKIGESVRTVRASPPLPQATTHSMEALRLHAQSMRGNSDFSEMLPFSQRAVEVDPEFAIAWRRLATLYSNLGIRPAARDSAAMQAYALRFKTNPTERLRIEAYYYSLIKGDRARAAAAQEEILVLGDSGPDVMSQLGELYWRRREFAKAERFQRAALATNRGVSFLYYANLSEKLLEQGKIAAADSLLGVAISRNGALWPLQSNRVRLLYHSGRFAEYEHALDSLRSLTNPTIRREATGYLADLLLVQGRLREWARVREEGAALNRAADARRVATDPLEPALVDFWIRRDTARAVKGYQAALAARPPTQPQRLSAAGFFATAGRTDFARSTLAQYEAAADTSHRRRFAHLVHRVEAAIANTDRRTNDALDQVRRGDMLPDGPADQCVICPYASLGAVFDRAGMMDSTIVMYERYVETINTSHLTEDRYHLARILARLGELHEIRGNREGAIRYYSQFVELWQRADPELQPRVADVRRRLARLRGAS